MMIKKEIPSFFCVCQCLSLRTEDLDSAINVECVRILFVFLFMTKFYM